MCHHLLNLCTSIQYNTIPTELTSDQSPVFHCGQRNSLQGWTVSLSLWLHLLSSPPASAAFRHTAPRRRVPPPQLLEHWSTNVWASTSAINLNKLTHKTNIWTQTPHFLQQSHLWPGRVFPASWVTISMATFLVIRFALTATVAIINLLGLAICTADFGTEYFQGTISQAALGCTLTLTGNMPPTSGVIDVSIFHKTKWRKTCWLVAIGTKGWWNC